ncbi:MAG: threonine/serine exporter family protein [Clostridia bacterium]|nr:threonine/serine exporter family protein [Clostridia bacterium]
MEAVNYQRLGELLLDMGESMLSCGAEIQRIEDTIFRMSMAYGAVKANVFVITSSIVLTLNFEDGAQITNSRRVLSSSSTDFEKLESFNALSRRCAEVPLALDDLAQELTTINRKRIPSYKMYIGSALAAGGFAVFFGGNLWDGLAAALFGLLICFLQIKAAPVCPNTVFFNFISSFICGVLICLVGKFVPVLHADKVIIGDIMLLIPGIAITNATRDMLLGDTISGVMKMMQCLLWAGALACGFMLAISLIGG